ncbi:hypothetical protein Kim5_CH02893 [Rhizobium sp. Kim5]|uniref:hypothetical protein n=1 Tax=Rhizobium sp. Kim5 TaxID=2020311 RepID=UPI0001902ACF|nr:hypothetical protein [Rhizobium sp. Kim5]ARQ58936.1 hypothetical protein Kim5_CH02893 [Rhizobium sp. Kim5]
MGTFTSNRTSPTDVAIRLQEVEAVLKGVLDKLADLTAPEPPDLTEVKAALDRAYKIMLFGADAGGQGNGWGVSPQSEKIFDNGDQQRSLFTTVFGVDGYGYAWAEYMTQDSSSSVMRPAFGNETNIAEWLDNAGHSLATITVGSPTLLGQLDGTTLIEKIFDLQSDVTSLKSRMTAVENRLSAGGL